MALWKKLVVITLVFGSLIVGVNYATEQTRLLGVILTLAIVYGYHSLHTLGYTIR